MDKQNILIPHFKTKQIKEITKNEEIVGVRGWQSNIIVPAIVTNITNSFESGYKVVAKYKAETSIIYIPSNTSFLIDNNKWEKIDKLLVGDKIKGLSGLSLLYYKIDSIQKIEKNNFLKIETDCGSYLLNKIIIKNNI